MGVNPAILIGREVTVNVVDTGVGPGCATVVAVTVSETEADDGVSAGGVYTTEALGPVVLMEPHGPPLQPVPLSCHVAFWLVAQLEMLAVIVIGAAPACTEFVFGFSVNASVIGGFTVKGNPAAVLP